MVTFSSGFSTLITLITRIKNFNSKAVKLAHYVYGVLSTRNAILTNFTSLREEHSCGLR